MDVAAIPKAEAALRGLAAECDHEEVELTGWLVRRRLVDPWRLQRRQVQFPAAAEQPATDVDVLEDHLLEVGVLRPEEVTGLTQHQRNVVVRETEAAYQDFCEDAERGKVIREGAWSPPWVFNRAGLRSVVEKALRDFNAGRITLRGFRARVRVAESGDVGGARPAKLKPSTPFTRYVKMSRGLVLAAGILRGELAERGTLTPARREQLRALAADVRTALALLEAATAAPGDDASVTDDARSGTVPHMIPSTAPCPGKASPITSA